MAGAPRGNHNALKGKEATDALRKAVNEVVESGDNKGRKKLHAIAQKIADCAVDGEPWAVSAVFDRLEGKPHQSIGVSEENPLEEENTATLTTAAALLQALTDRASDVGERDSEGSVH